MTTHVLSQVASAITNSRRFSAQLRLVQHLFDIAQPIRPLRVFGTGDWSARKTAPFIAAKLIEKTRTAALTATLAGLT
jgi:hypothetical protein